MGAVSFEKPSFYDTLHPTWVATQSLRDRNFEFDRPGNVKWADYMGRCIRVSNFRKATYKVKYARSKGRRRSMSPIPCAEIIPAALVDDVENEVVDDVEAKKK